ncbi:peptidoglycan D,D-transpeptidase FtsI family protein [Paenibacillus koleovorans]|uniref:peptidoglycan D,D-transpeptidase FtsI family protein n=1 Tax=Paenibacillus koleovorans TaxID=121608 RepID=UPI000FDA07F2|nr:penicillin-binding transpeptidase domain-containing protein [Paenibacillus koleovorans]
MSTHDETQEELHKKRHFSFRLNLFFLCIFALFSLLIVRLALLQLVHGQELSAQEGSLSSKHHSIPPIRGTIFDQKGYPLAESISTQSLFYSVEPGNKDKDAIIALAYRIEKLFADYGDPKKTISAEEILRRMDVGYNLEKKATKDPSYYSIPRRIKADLTNAEIAYISEHRDELPGMEVQEESIRQYNEKTIAVQLVGYLKSFSTARTDKNLAFYREKAKSTSLTEQYMDTEDVGFDGIELLYQEQLRGSNGVKSYPVNAAEKIIGPVSLIKPEKGNNLYLTINKDVQLETETAIMEHLSYIRNPARDRWTYAPHAITGYAVAMEVDTGKVVAMASMPDYDPNVWKGGISQEDYDRVKYFVENGTIREVRPPYKEQKELNQHPTSLVYLGSTIKPLTVLLGLNEKLMGIYEEYNDTGVFYYGKDNKASLSNSEGKVNGRINAAAAIQVSSNTYMSAMVGNRLYFRPNTNGLQVWDQYMERFGLGVLTGSGLRGEYAGFKEYRETEKKYGPQAALIPASWGQMGKYTTLQLAQYAAMLGNRGKRMKPLFVDRVTTYDGQWVESPQPQVLNVETFPKEYWDTVQKGMELVGKQGFGGFPYRVASKTGTSTQSVAGKEIDNAVFIAYAPAEKPKLAVAVVIPEGGYGSYGAAPIARRIFDAYDREVGLTGAPNPNAGGAAGGL